jgi:hypothetical protein
VQKGSALALACRPLVFSGVWRSRPPGGGSLWGPGLGPLYALDKLVRACASSPKISWGGQPKSCLPVASVASTSRAHSANGIRYGNLAYMIYGIRHGNIQYAISSGFWPLDFPLSRSFY